MWRTPHSKFLFSKIFKQMITRLFFVIILFFALAKSQSDNGGIPVEVDCAVRNLALQYSQVF
jgi:hypothetical protein